ncbi:hypothetical protein LguiA_013659 [Lonicera macranthoides]
MSQFSAGEVCDDDRKLSEDFTVPPNIENVTVTGLSGVKKNSVEPKGISCYKKLLEMVELDSEKPGVNSLQPTYIQGATVEFKGGFMVDYGIGLGGAGPVLVQGGVVVDLFDPRCRLLRILDLVEPMVELDSEKPGVELLQLTYTQGAAVKVVVQVIRFKGGFMVYYGIDPGGPALV